MRIESDFAPFYDGRSICLDMIDTLPDNLKGWVSNWFEMRRVMGTFSYGEFIQYFKDTFADLQALQSTSEYWIGWSRGRVSSLQTSSSTSNTSWL